MTANQDNNNDSIMTDMITMIIFRKYDNCNDIIFLNKRIKIKNYHFLFLENINI
jgi:hypothetical protein